MNISPDTINAHLEALYALMSKPSAEMNMWEAVALTMAWCSVQLATLGEDEQALLLAYSGNMAADMMEGRRAMH